MARDAGKVSRRVIGRDSKLQSAERRCAGYRRAFQLLLDEPFDDLDNTIDRMLKILATTLDVGRVGFWTVDTNYSSIRCEHVFSADSARPLGPTSLGPVIVRGRRSVGPAAAIGPGLAPDQFLA